MNDTSLSSFSYVSKSKTRVDLNGISNINISKELSFNNNISLGQLVSPMQVNSPQEIKISFDRDYVQKDSIIEFTGTSPISGAYLYNGNSYYKLNNLYLNSYSASFSVGELPKIKTSFTSYGEDIEQVTSPLFNNLPISSESIALDIPKLGSISISGLSESDNAIKTIYNILSFDYSIDIIRQPYYSIGSGLKPVEVCEITPLGIKFSLTSKIKDENMLINIPKIVQNNLNFDIIVSGTSHKINYEIRNAQLVQTEILSNSNDLIEIRRNFIGYYGI